jgi:hypothetical protein
MTHAERKTDDELVAALGALFPAVEDPEPSADGAALDDAVTSLGDELAHLARDGEAELSWNLDLSKCSMTDVGAKALYDERASFGRLTRSDLSESTISGKLAATLGVSWSGLVI